MFDAIKNRWNSRKQQTSQGFCFSRPLIILQSNDWGRVGVRDREGYEQLRAGGIHLGENPYDYYSLETAEDVMALRDMLKRHHDSTGRPACLVMNFLLANLDFQKTASTGFQRIHLMPLSQGLPGAWRRPGLFEAYRQGISDSVFHPGLHGLTHFCQLAVDRALAVPGDRSNLLHTLWKAETLYIYWRMPWIGYEYCNPEKPQAGFLDAQSQSSLIAEAVREFKKVFKVAPLSACAPGYLTDRETCRAWSNCGVRIAQKGRGAALPPHVDEWEILNVHRTIEFEPFERGLPLEKYMQLAEHCFAHGIPAVVSMRSINFHSSLKDFRSPTLRLLDEFLSALESKYPNLLYIHDANLYEIVTRASSRVRADPFRLTSNSGTKRPEAGPRGVSWYASAMVRAGQFPRLARLRCSPRKYITLGMADEGQP